MENQEKKAGWRIWLYLTPVYLLLLWPLARWSMNMKAGDLNISREDYSAFASSEGEIKQWGELTEPEFVDGVLRVRYFIRGEAPAEPLVRAGDHSPYGGGKGSAAEKTSGDRGGAGKSGGGTGGMSASKAAYAGIKKTDVSEVQRREQMSVGHQTGYLTKAVGAAMKSPKAVGALLNNQYVVAGFMARGTVKQATSSPEALKAYLQGQGPSNFINNPVVKAALDNPAVLSAVASSGMIGAMLDTPAAKALMSDPNAVADLVTSNPELVNLAMQNPQLLSTMMSNPDVSGLLGKFDTSKVKFPI
ncbi:MAG: hypothetical protein FD189_2508 [Elusimicrobia bacterium]|nr:MAG: hypothetical protein FD154_1 [Elusimicrobiota bacterium]KAF0152144.1 MAG: hypothetical protein FD189_2508 [Elusimicrobiota bacterium]